MKLQPNRIKLMSNNGIYGLLVELKPGVDLDKLNKLINADKPITLDIDIKREKRSLQANKALWAMLNDMAVELHTTSDELYLEMLERYGVFTYVIAQKKALYRVKAEWRTVVEVGDIEVNGKPGVQLKCFYGSSKLNSKEFARLLDGVIGEAREIGVEYISQEERNSIINNWKGE